MSNSKKFVCGDCIDDDGIRGFIAANAEASQCSFCQAIGDGPIAAPLDEVGDYVNRCLRQEYGDALVDLPFDSEEWVYFGTNWDSKELLTDAVELELPNDHDGALLDDLVGYLDDITWCERNGLGLTDREYAQYNWSYFCDVVMRRRRFFFLDVGPDPSEPEVYDPGHILRNIFNAADQLGLFTKLPAGKQLYRARWEDPGAQLETPQKLGPPPEEKATQANRMSAPGIVMFYACDEIETALLEVAQEPGLFAVGRWRILRPAIVLDLTMIPAIPALFQCDPEGGQDVSRRAVTFLRHVADQISRPIARDDRIHVEYVPTQVVTEFVRARVRWQRNAIDGVKYESAAHPGHASYVLFANQEDIVVDTSENRPEEQPWLELIDVKHWSGRLGRRALTGRDTGKWLVRITGTAGASALYVNRYGWYSWRQSW